MMLQGPFCANGTICSNTFCPPLSTSFSIADWNYFAPFDRAKHSVSSHNCRSALIDESLTLKTRSSQRKGTAKGSSHNDLQNFLYLLRQCCESGNLAEGMSLHQRIFDCGYGENRLLANTLIQMYGRCGAFTRAVDVFSSVQDKNIYTWTIMLSACIDCGKIKDALEIFNQSPEWDLVGWNVIILACAQHGLYSQARHYYQCLLQKCTPNKITFLNILPLCKDVDELIQVHSHISNTGLDCDISVANSLLNMYHKCCKLSKAEQMFRRISEPDICTWNTMISALVQREKGEDAFLLFTEMQNVGIGPDRITYIGIIDACTSNQDSNRCLGLHQHVINDGFESDLLVGTALINMYGKTNVLDAAKTSFNKMFLRDSIAWNAVMDAYARQGQCDSALQLFAQMQSEGFAPDCATIVSLLASCILPKSLTVGKRVHIYIYLFGFEVDVTLGNSLLNMYGKCGSFDEAFVIFDKMAERNLISWNSMINACAECKQDKFAFELFQGMIEQGIEPDGVTFLAVIDACTNLANLSKAKCIHSHAERCGLALDAMISSALMKMYTKCGSLEDVQKVFDETPFKDVVLWNTIISSYAQHGHGEKALEVYEKMKIDGAKPDDSTLSIVLSACAHSGFASQGRQYFLEMSCNYGISPTKEHFNFLLDLFGRTGQISDVENLIEQMPVEPNATSWMTFLSAYTKHMDTQVEKSVVSRALAPDSIVLEPFALCGNAL